MQHTPSFFVKMLFIALLVVLVGLVGRWLPLNWGRVEQAQQATITVTGKADDVHANQVATFTAGVTVSEVDRDAAVEAVNTQMAVVIAAIKAFGIADADVKTQTVNVYEFTEPAQEMLLIYPPRPAAGEKKWQATNSVEIKLRDVSRASELATLLTNADESVTVSGPNFTTDDTTELDQVLLQQAVQDARDKAEAMLAGTGQRITRIVNIYENDYGAPYFAREMSMNMTADGGVSSPAPIEPGSQTIYKSVGVVFEISY